MTVSSLSRQLSGMHFNPKPKITGKEIYLRGRSILGKVFQMMEDLERVDHHLEDQALHGNYDALVALFNRSKHLDQRVFRVLTRDCHMPFIARLLVDCSKMDEKEAVNYFVKGIREGNHQLFWVLERFVEDGDPYARVELERVLLDRDIKQGSLWMDADAYRARIEEFVTLTNESPGEDYLLFYLVSDELRKDLDLLYSWNGAEWYAHFMEYISDEMLIELEMGTHFRQSVEDSYQKPLCLAMQTALAKIVLGYQKIFGFRDSEPIVQRSREVLMVNSCV